MATWRQSVASAHGPHAARAGVRASPSELGTSTHRRQVSLHRVSAHLFHLHLWTSRSTFLAKCSEPKQVLRSNSVESAVFQSGDRAVVLAGQIGGALPPQYPSLPPHKAASQFSRLQKARLSAERGMWVPVPQYSIDPRLQARPSSHGKLCCLHRRVLLGRYCFPENQAGFPSQSPTRITLSPFLGLGVLLIKR